jgi:hypothetical protein
MRGKKHCNSFLQPPKKVATYFRHVFLRRPLMAGTGGAWVKKQKLISGVFVKSLFHTALTTKSHPVGLAAPPCKL